MDELALDRAKLFAENWESEFINIGNAGHINASSGYTNWNEGLEILKKLKPSPTAMVCQNGGRTAKMSIWNSNKHLC